MAWYEYIAKISKRLGCSITIKDREGIDDYLERFYLMPRWITLGLFRVVIHRFWRSDNPLDGLHDHPWPYISIILKGGYIEHTICGAVKRLPGDIIFSCANHFHRVELLEENTDTWTLFIMGPRCRKWGFLIDGKWYNWKDWIDRRQVKL